MEVHMGFVLCKRIFPPLIYVSLLYYLSHSFFNLLCLLSFFFFFFFVSLLCYVCQFFLSLLFILFIYFDFVFSYISHSAFSFLFSSSFDLFSFKKKKFVHTQFFNKKMCYFFILFNKNKIINLYQFYFPLNK